MSDTPMSAPEGSGRLRPLVARPASNKAIWIFAGCALIGGTALFASLENRRSAITAPAIAPGAGDDALIGASVGASGMAGGGVAPIVIPPDVPEPVPVYAPMPPAPIQNRFAAAPKPVTRSSPVGSFTPPAFASPAPASTMTASTPSSPEVVYDAARSRPQGNLVAATEGGDPGKGVERVQAGHFANPATTVPKGTVIQAVLESALDSTRPGLARAIISRDVVGFDGSKVLIARGSRLVGEYKADLTSGQSRAMIQWQRLMRPDGVIINLDSPSADPLGRAGVKGKVNGHFLAQWGGAILQSSLNIGEQVAANKLAGSTAIYALPGLYATPNITGSTNTQTGTKVQPTLTVKQGTSVSVFVARDLDFTSVE